MSQKINAIQDTRYARSRTFTEEEDAIILQYFRIKHKHKLAALLGMCANTLRKRYFWLVENADKK